MRLFEICLSLILCVHCCFGNGESYRYGNTGGVNFVWRTTEAPTGLGNINRSNMWQTPQTIATAFHSPSNSPAYTPTNPTNLITPTNPITPPIQYSPNAQLSDAIASSVSQFAHDVGQQLMSSPYASKSEIFSPLSLVSALTLLQLGAKGKSYQELRQLFRLDVESKDFNTEFSAMVDELQLPFGVRSNRVRPEVNWRNTAEKANIRGKTKKQNNATNEHVVNVANGIFTQKGYSINRPYREVVTSVYHSELVPLEFQDGSARHFINNWVAERTYGKIPNIISDEIPSGTNMIMASALYFKGFWDTPFLDRATIVDDFFPDGRSRPPIKVNMMANGGIFPYYNSSEYGCRIIGLPYKDNLTTLYIIQPHDSNRDRLRQLQAALSAPMIEDLISKMSLQTSVLAFPKMHLTRNVNMKNMLGRLGVSAIFQRGVSDLSLIGLLRRNVQNTRTALQNAPGILYRFNQTILLRPARSIWENLEMQRTALDSVRSDLFVEDIVHEVDFNINEQGTEAAAATVTYLRRSGPDVLFRVETPFLMLLRHDPTKLILFYGIINEPPL